VGATFRPTCLREAMEEPVEFSLKSPHWTTILVFQHP
jgi:hypothetical protein